MGNVDHHEDGDSMNVVLSAKRVSFIVDMDAIEGGPTTMKLCGKITDFGEMYQAAFAMLMEAVKRQDAEGIKLYFDATVYFEQMQRLAAVETREHLRKRRMQKVECRS
jgi:hypothetical protein